MRGLPRFTESFPSFAQNDEQRPNIKRLLHEYFHIGLGISPRLPYQARQRSWTNDMSRADIRDDMENFMS
jgi:hypothetical protein